VRAPGLHPAQNRPLVGRVPSPGTPISSTMSIACLGAHFFLAPRPPGSRKESAPLSSLRTENGRYTSKPRTGTQTTRMIQKTRCRRVRPWLQMLETAQPTTMSQITTMQTNMDRVNLTASKLNFESSFSNIRGLSDGLAANLLQQI
jgi:hypothetical protein